MGLIPIKNKSLILFFCFEDLFLDERNNEEYILFCKRGRLLNITLKINYNIYEFILFSNNF